VLHVRIRHRIGSLRIDAGFTAPDRGVTALYGPSGSGKTTLVNAVAGLVRPDGGRIAAGERILFDSATRTFVPPERRRVGYVFQDGRLFPHMSVRSNLVYGMRRGTAGERRVNLERIVDLLGIGGLLGRRPATLSGGEKQRVAIGRALLASPRILLMDEPLASLDPARKDEVLPFVSLLARDIGLPILYVSHSVDEILRVADVVVHLVGGRCAASGRVERMLLPLTGS